MLNEKELSQALQLLNQIAAMHTQAVLYTEEITSLIRRGVEWHRTRGHGRELLDEETILNRGLSELGLEPGPFAR